MRLNKLFRSPIFLSALIVTAATCILYGPMFHGDVPLPTKSITGLTWGSPSSPAQSSIFRDRIVQAFPYHAFAAAAIQQGHFPWWNHLIFAGTTFFANGQAGLFSLLKLPFWWLPAWLSYDIVTLVQSVVAGIGFAVLARKLRWHPAAGVAAGVTLTLSAPFVMRMTVTTMSAVFAALPWVYWAVYRLHEELTWKRVTLVAGCIAVMIFSGHVQLAAFALALTACWVALWWKRDQWKRRLVFFIAAFALGLGLTSVQMLPVQEALGQAYRQPHDTPWSRILDPKRLFVPNLSTGRSWLSTLDQNIWGPEQHYKGPGNYLEANMYVGPLAMVAVFLSFAYWRKKIWRLFVVLAGLTAGLYLFTSWWALVGKVFPWITVTVVWRTSFVLAFTLAMLAGLGVQWLSEKKYRWLPWVFVALMLVVSLWQWQGILPFEPRSTLFPASPLLTRARELTLDGSRVWTPNGALDELMAYDVPIAVGYDSVYPASYLELWTANSASIAKRNQLVPVNPNDGVLRVTGSNYMITRDALPVGWTEVMTEGDWRLARRDLSTPTVHTVRQLVQTNNPARIGTIDPATEATINGDAPRVEAEAMTTVTVLERSSTKLKTRVVTSGATALVTTLQAYPGWRLRIDGHAADAAAVKVNYAFQGAAVSAGDHIVEFAYVPQSFYLGMGLSIVSLLILLLGGWVTPKYRPTKT